MRNGYCNESPRCNVHVNYLENSLHDIKTPISIVSIMLQNIHESIALNDEQQRYFDTTKKYVSKVIDILQSTNDYAKIIRSSYEPRFVEADIVALVKETTLQAEAMAARKGIRLDFGSNTQTMPMLLDSRVIEKIVLNLLSNAIKFAPMSGNVAVCVNNIGGIACIVVSDDGEGFPPEMLENGISRYATAKEYNPNGSGIGLSIVEELAHMFGGTVTLGTSPQGGATVTVALPAVCTENAAGGESSADAYYGVQLQLM